MDSRLKSALATILINGALGYALIMVLVMAIPQEAPNRTTLIDVAADPAPLPPRNLPLPPVSPIVPIRPALEWAIASPVQRDLAFAANFKWVQDNLSEEEKRFGRWRSSLPQGSGAKVTRLRPANLPTHTVYWPAGWSKGPLPIIAWGNDYDGICANSSLPYAAFLAEIASHGYFVVAVGNDDIDYPQPEGLEILADGRPIRTQASALTKGVDWAIAENTRAGSPYAGKLDTGRIAYMGHGCGGEQAMAASSDPRTTTTVVLNAAGAAPDTSDARKASIAQFEGGKDEGGDAAFANAKAAGRPMVKAVLEGLGHDDAYPGPDRRWSKAVVAWLDWQLKGDSKAATMLAALRRDGWTRIATTGL